MTHNETDDRQAVEGTDDRQAVDETGDPIAHDDPDDPRNEPMGPRDGPGGREIVVPLRLYKTITVFSTLIAVVAFFAGFVLIDAATLQVSYVREAILLMLGWIGFVPANDVLTAALAILGLTSIVGGTVVYVIGTRFRARGMGKSQEDSG